MYCHIIDNELNSVLIKSNPKICRIHMLANANGKVNDNADDEDDFRIVYLPKFG